MTPLASDLKVPSLEPLYSLEAGVGASKSVPSIVATKPSVNGLKFLAVNLTLRDRIYSIAVSTVFCPPLEIM